MCTPCEDVNHADSQGKVAACINVGNGKGSLSWVWQQSENSRLADPVLYPWPLTFWTQNQYCFRQIVEDYHCAKFQSIPIRGFRLIHTPQPPTHRHTHMPRDKMIAISAPPLYYVIGADNKYAPEAIIIIYCESKKCFFSAAILPNVDRSIWNLAEIRCCTEYNPGFSCTPIGVSLLQAKRKRSCCL